MWLHHVSDERHRCLHIPVLGWVCVKEVHTVLTGVTKNVRMSFQSPSRFDFLGSLRPVGVSDGGCVFYCVYYGAQRLRTGHASSQRVDCVALCSRKAVDSLVYTEPNSRFVSRRIFEIASSASSSFWVVWSNMSTDVSTSFSRTYLRRRMFPDSGSM